MNSEKAMIIKHRFSGTVACYDSKINVVDIVSICSLIWQKECNKDALQSKLFEITCK